MLVISPTVWGYSQELAWGFQILTGVLTGFILFFSLQTNPRTKAADIRMQFQHRYDALLTPPLPQGGQAVPAEVWEHHCRRFWNLQNDQFLEWQNGWLEDK